MKIRGLFPPIIEVKTSIVQHNYTAIENKWRFALWWGDSRRKKYIYVSLVRNHLFISVSAVFLDCHIQTASKDAGLILTLKPW